MVPIPGVGEAAAKGALERVRAAMLPFDSDSGNIRSVNSFTKTLAVSE